MRHIMFTAVFVACCFFTALAEADERIEGGGLSPHEASDSHVTFGGSVGGASSRGSDYDAGATVRLEGAYGYSALRIGLLADGSTAGFSSHRAGFAATAGVNLTLGALVLDLRGIAGLHGYSRVGASFLGSDPGVAGAVSYAGGEVGLGLSPADLRTRDGRACVGLVLYLHRDLSSKTSTYSFVSRESNWFSGADTYSSKTQTRTIGGATELGLALRVTFDFQPRR